MATTFKSVVAVLVVLLSLNVHAYNAYIDGIYYNVVTKLKTAEVTYGENKYSGDVNIPLSIEYNGVTCSVTSIGGSAFVYCRGLTAVDIPGSVTSIGERAFRDCSSLTAVSVGNGVTSIGSSAFFGCSGLTSVSIPNSVTSIGESAFENCSGLISVSIPSSVTSICGEAFANCMELTDVYCYPENVPSVITVINGTRYEGPFNNSLIEYATLHVPEESIEAYRTTEPWNGFGTFVCIEEYTKAPIGSNGFATFCSMESLDFSEVEDVRAYTVSTYQPKKGEVTLTRVYEVPAGMGLVLIGKEGEYEIPLGTGKAVVSNLLVGINENTTLKATENDRTNFILPEDQEKAAFCAVTDEVELPFGKAYLPLPTESVAHLEDGKLTLHLADPSHGDVDGDGYVNISDVTTLVNIILGK